MGNLEVSPFESWPQVMIDQQRATFLLVDTGSPVDSTDRRRLECSASATERDRVEARKYARSCMPCATIATIRIPLHPHRRSSLVDLEFRKTSQAHESLDESPPARAVGLISAVCLLRAGVSCRWDEEGRAWSHKPTILSAPFGGGRNRGGVL